MDPASSGDLAPSPIPCTTQSFAVSNQGDSAQGVSSTSTTSGYGAVITSAVVAASVAALANRFLYPHSPTMPRKNRSRKKPPSGVAKKGKNVSGENEKMKEDEEEIQEESGDAKKGSTLKKANKNSDCKPDWLFQPSDVDVSFEGFPYPFLCKKLQEVLASEAFFTLSYPRSGASLNLESKGKESSAVLLQGPPGSQRYQVALAKAISKQFGAKFGIVSPESAMKKAVSSSLLSALWSASWTSDVIKEQSKFAGMVTGNLGNSEDLASVTRAVEMEGKCVVLVLPLFASSHTAQCLQLVKKLKSISRVFVIGCSIKDDKKESDKDAFGAEDEPSVWNKKIPLPTPKEGKISEAWTKMLRRDARLDTEESNRRILGKALDKCGLKCESLDQLQLGAKEIAVLGAEDIVKMALSKELATSVDEDVEEGNSSNVLQITAECLQECFDLVAEVDSHPHVDGENAAKANGQVPEGDAQGKSGLRVGIPSADASAPRIGTPKGGERTPRATEKGSVKGGSPTQKPLPGPAAPASSTSRSEEAEDNEFEKRIRPEVLPPDAINVTFESVGALEDVKAALHESVMLPLRHPEFFQKGGLVQPCKGILLFGPPGTGKTMLAKAVATESGANFINVSMSTITSKWFGEDEKNVRALFSLAEKISPTVVFIDEVDSMLGRRNKTGEHEAMRKIKNEFMTHWDGLASKAASKVLVLAATNRPFDLDEAIIRRFERRIMVGLPDAENREKILRAVLANETLSQDVDLKELAALTDGFSGSDLKAFCVAAAYRPLKEALAELTKENEDANKLRPKLRSLSKADFTDALNQVSASVASEGSCTTELAEWNEMYGEGGSRKSTPLSYFL